MGELNFNSLRRRWSWFGLTALLLGSLVIYLIVPGRIAPSAPDPVEVAASDPSHDGPARRFVVRQHHPGQVILMNWVLEEKANPGWKRIGGETFHGTKVLDREQGYTFSITPPASATGCRVRVQYGVGLHGLQLWRERARVACRTRRWVASLTYNEFEMDQSVIDLAR